MERKDSTGVLNFHNYVSVVRRERDEDREGRRER